MASIQPLLAGYPTGTPTSNPDLDLAQRSGSSSINEYFGSFRLDHRINDKFTQYLRYNRDQGYLTQPLDVTGSGQIVTGVPQNVVYTLNQILKPTVVNETKLGFNGSKTRINGFTPVIPGVDTSAFAVSFTGTVAIPGVGGQGASAGAAALGNLVRGNSSQNGRGQPYTNYTMSFIDNLSVIRTEPCVEIRFRIPSDPPVYGPAGRHHLHVREYRSAVGEHAVEHPGSRRHQRARPVEQRRHR